MDVVCQASSKQNTKSPVCQEGYDPGQNSDRYSVPKDKIYIVMFSLRHQKQWSDKLNRLEQSDLKLAQEIEYLLLSTANGNVTEISDSVSKFIEGDIDKSRLLIQDMINTAMDGSIKKTTNLRTIAQAMDKSNIYLQEYAQ